MSASLNPPEERTHLRRSFLFVPGSDERKLAKAPGLGADAVDGMEDGNAARDSTLGR